MEDMRQIQPNVEFFMLMIFTVLSILVVLITYYHNVLQTSTSIHLVLACQSFHAGATTCGIYTDDDTHPDASAPYGGSLQRYHFCELNRIHQL